MKRTPLKRKTPMKRGARLARKPYRWKGRDAMTRKADQLAAAIVHGRRICAVCGNLYKVRGDHLEQHHARGRGKGFRWRVESHLLLCSHHHRTSTVLSAHGAPAAFDLWLDKYHPDILAMADVPETPEQAVARMKQ